MLPNVPVRGRTAVDFAAGTPPLGGTTGTAMLMRSPLARTRRRPPGFIPPAKPVLSAVVPTGPNWIHELKHDGLCRKERDRVQLLEPEGPR